MKSGPERPERYDTPSGHRRNDTTPAGSQEKEKGKVPNFWLSSEIEKMTDLQKVLEEGILDSRVELTFVTRRSCTGRYKGGTLLSGCHVWVIV